MLLWSKHLDKLIPPGFPRFRVWFPSKRRYPHPIPEDIERLYIYNQLLEAWLLNPKYQQEWWEPLRKGASPLTPMPSTIAMKPQE
jgi:hypothetical protein